MAKEDEVQTEDEVLKAKVALYNKLLYADVDRMTTGELDAMYRLSRDERVQQFIDRESYDKGTS